MSHGTVAGYNKHVRTHTIACDPCLAAWAMYTRDRRARDACTPGLGWPVRTTPGVGPAGQVPSRRSGKRTS